MTSPYTFKTIGNKDNPSILFLHGFMGSHKSWLPIAEKLSENYHCILVDLPGHGKSITDLADMDYQFMTCATNIMKIIGELNINKTHLVGYSMGGRLALYLSLKYPRFFDKVILESASPGIESEAKALERLEKDEQIVDILKKGELLKVLGDWYEQPIFGNLTAHPEFENLLTDRMENDAKALSKSLHFMGVGQQASLWEGLSRLENQTLHISGEYDTKFVDIGMAMRARNELIKTAIIPCVGHYAHFEKPELFLEYIREFLTPPSLPLF